MPPESTDLLARQGSARIQCQCCGRMLVPLKDGTSRNHHPRRYGSDVDLYDRSYCRGSGYQLTRWKPRQQLRHHSGDIWVVVKDQGGRWGDYWLECLSGREKGRAMVAHGEYMHRHGWTPTVALAVVA